MFPRRTREQRPDSKSITQYFMRLAQSSSDSPERQLFHFAQQSQHKHQDLEEPIKVQPNRLFQIKSNHKQEQSQADENYYSSQEIKEKEQSMQYFLKSPPRNIDYDLDQLLELPLDQRFDPENVEWSEEQPSQSFQEIFLEQQSPLVKREDQQEYVQVKLEQNNQENEKLVSSLITDLKLLGQSMQVVFYYHKMTGKTSKINSLNNAYQLFFRQYRRMQADLMEQMKEYRRFRQGPARRTRQQAKSSHEVENELVVTMEADVKVKLEAETIQKQK